MAFIKKREMTPLMHQQDDKGDHYGSMVKCSHEILDRKNGAVPVRIDGHYPIDHGK